MSAARRTVRKNARRPLYARLLRLRHVRPGSLLCFLFFEGSIFLGALLAFAELVPWWVAVLLPVVVALMVKLNDVIAGAVGDPGAPLAAEDEPLGTLPPDPGHDDEPDEDAADDQDDVDLDEGLDDEREHLAALPDSLHARVQADEPARPAGVAQGTDDESRVDAPRDVRQAPPGDADESTVVAATDEAGGTDGGATDPSAAATTTAGVDAAAGADAADVPRAESTQPTQPTGPVDEATAAYPAVRAHGGAEDGTAGDMPDGDQTDDRVTGEQLVTDTPDEEDAAPDDEPAPDEPVPERDAASEGAETVTADGERTETPGGAAVAESRDRQDVDGGDRTAAFPVVDVTAGTGETAREPDAVTDAGNTTPDDVPRKGTLYGRPTIPVPDDPDGSERR